MPGNASAPHIAGTAVALTTHRYEQDEVARVLTGGGPEFARFAQTSGVDTRSLALPLSRYPELTGFTEANDACMHVAVPTIDARLASRMGFRADIKRVPLFGLGCVAGAAGMARAQHRPAVVVRGDAR